MRQTGLSEVGRVVIGGLSSAAAFAQASAASMPSTPWWGGRPPNGEYVAAAGDARLPISWIATASRCPGPDCLGARSTAEAGSEKMVYFRPLFPAGRWSPTPCRLHIPRHRRPPCFVRCSRDGPPSCHTTAAPTLPLSSRDPSVHRVSWFLLHVLAVCRALSLPPQPPLRP